MKRTMIVVALMCATAAYASGTAFFKYERVTGMTKQCVYDYLGSEVTVTQPAVSLCPLTIQVP
jgi:hypothetical protein